MKKEPTDLILSPIRFRIVKLLNPEEKSASELAEELQIGLKLASFHLQKLARNGILQSEYREKTVQNRPVLIRYYSLTDYARDYMEEMRKKMKPFK